MKKFNTFLVLIIALLTSQWSMAQCTGSIAVSGNDPSFTFTFNTSSTNPYIFWDYGDNSFASGNSNTQTHTYTTNGTYSVVASYIDSTVTPQCFHNDTVTVVVSSIGATCSAAFTTSGNSPTFTFTPTGTPTAPPGYYSYDWDFGDGTVAWGNNNPTHTYTANGTYNVTCILYDSIWCTDSVTTTITVTGASPSTCDASFTVGGNGPTYFFNATNFNPGDSLQWTFGDGNSTSGSVNPSHTYSANGTYQVFLYVTNGSCIDSSSVFITVTNATTCDASFTFIDSNGVYNFMASFPTTTSSYMWTLSDGSIYSGANPIVTLTQSGTYTMCLDIYDSSALCFDSSCVTFTYNAGGGTTCDAQFSYTNQGNTYSFVPNSPDPLAVYSWSFGDGNSSNVLSPTHTYATAGSYFVQCSLSTPTGCTAFYDTLVYIAPGPAFGSISGVVNMGSSYADFGVVFLIGNDSTGSLSLIDTAIIDSLGMYYFANVAYGTYLVKAALSPMSSSFTSYLPTYHTNTPSGNNGVLLWSDASDVVLNAPYLNYIDIDLIAGNNAGGPGFIGGLVSQGANKTGDPISDINIMVYDQNGAPVAYTYSDNQGTFQISNLPFGTYTIYPEVQGRVTTPITSTLTAIHPGEDEVRVTVNKTTVEVGLTTGVEPQPLFADIQLYPNPVQEELIIEMNNILEGNSLFTITDLSGKIIKTFSGNFNNVLRINTSDWSEGMYFLTIENNGELANFKIVK